MIDLHIHSIHSDGTDTVIDILKKAEMKALEYISITDHNTCSAYEELKNINIREYYTGQIITGVELNTVALGVPIEILGYDIDIEIMQKNLDGIYLSPKERNYLEIKRLYNKCMENGVVLNEDFIRNYTPEKYASKYLHEVLTQDERNRRFVDGEAWDDSLVLYRKYMSDPKSIFFVDMFDVLPTLDETINLIKRANGKIFLPHIFEYKHNSIDILEYIIKNYKIDGIECYYSTFSTAQTQNLVEVCKKRNLLISGGSDYHGLNDPQIQIGIGKGNLKVDSSILSTWHNTRIKKSHVKSADYER